MSAEDRLSRLLKLLQGSIRAAGFTQTEVDEKIGRRRGYLSHVFQRRVDLKLIDLLRSLQVLEIEPQRFFTAALGGNSTRGPLEGLMSLVANSSREDGMWPAAVPAQAPQTEDTSSLQLDEAQLMERVRAAVRTILEENQELQQASG